MQLIVIIIKNDTIFKWANVIKNKLLQFHLNTIAYFLKFFIYARTHAHKFGNFLLQQPAQATHLYMYMHKVNHFHSYTITHTHTHTHMHTQGYGNVRANQTLASIPSVIPKQCNMILCLLGQADADL